MTGSSETTRQDVVCILGMGRSGTSLVARVSNLVGLYLGPQHVLLQPNAGNPKGYWENSEIVDINDAILRHFGGTWDEPPVFPVGWEQDSSLDELKQRAHSLIENTYGRVNLWGWKDPRTCLTLPFWQRLLPETRYIICLRNPLSVAHSFKHLFDFTTDKSSNLWLTYVRSSLAHSEGKSRLIVFYQDIIDDWLAELRRLAYFLGQPDRAEQLFTQEAVREFIENDLEHYRSSTDELTNDSKISKSATELYLAYRGRARARQARAGDELGGRLEDPSGRLEFTGERFVPSVNGQIKYEHLHRYALALGFASGKSVLDIASGEGYGAALLARVAHSVVGVDIDPEVVSHSRNTYDSPNVDFIAGSCASIPLANASVDLVTSFETIEHHDQHEQMMLEIKRVLRPSGCLVISSPNRQTYSREQEHANPFHAKELDYHELQGLLSRHFKHVRVHGQKLATGSFVTPLNGVSGGEFGFYTGDASDLRRQIASLPAPVYFVAVCSDQAVEEWPVDSIYLDPKDELFEGLEAERLSLLAELSHAQGKYAEENLRAQEYQRHLESEIEKRSKHQIQLENELEKHQKYQTSLLDEIDKHREYQKTLTDEIDKYRQYQKTLTDELDKHLQYQKTLTDALDEHRRYQKTLTDELDEHRQYRTNVAGEIDEYKQYQAVLEKQASGRAQTIETLTANEQLAREQLELQSEHLGKLNQSMSEMRERISDLEGLLTKHYDEAKEKQAKLLASEEQVRESTQLAAELKQRSQRRKELLALMSAGETQSQTEPKASSWSGRFRRRTSGSSKQVWSGDLDTPKEELSVGSVLEISGSVRSSAAPVRLAGAFLDQVPLGILDHKAVSNPESLDSPGFGFAGRFSLDEFPPGRRTLQVRVIDQQQNIKDFHRTIIIDQNQNARPVDPHGKQSDRVGPNGNAGLAVHPDQVPVGKVVGVTNLTWDTGDGSYGEVYVSVNGEPETLFSSGPSGSQTAPWIVGGSSYKFCLYAGDQREHLLKEATAFGTIVPVTESRNALRELQNLSASKKALLTFAEMGLRSFLTSQSVLEFRPGDEPEVSIVLVLYNRAELTLQCLYSILRSDLKSYEVVIVDNASTDETSELLKRIKGARVIQNETNLHFLRACNQAVKLARGENVLLLNNDAQLMPGSISSALRTLHSSNDIGAVGGKIILADGTLQEAGSIIWQDGSCLGYGRGDSPLAPPYMYQRDVDYCSAAFLLTPRELFLSAGGFDEAFAPAYYEEVDYCVGLWERGKRVVYDPNSIIVHYEFGSSSSQSSAIDLQITNRETFLKKRGDWLQSQHAAPTDPLLAARRLHVNQRRILFLDDRVPHRFLGAGFPRSNRMLSELSNLGCAVTFYPTTCPREPWEDVYRDTSPEVEVILDHGGEKLKEFLRQRRDYYDAILISRPHNMAMFKEAVGNEPGLLNGARVIYDAEALFAYREIRKSAVAGHPLSEIEQENLIAEEVRLAENCDYVVSVSDRERDEFARHGCEHAFTLGHTVEVTPTEKKFEARQDLLFVGAIHSLSSPNADSMIWFVHEILPLIQKRLGDIKLTIAGLSCADFQRRVKSGSVQLVGKVDDLSPLYNEARVFVAPTRFSAGIPIKICDAAAHGLPTVTTNLSGYQLGWSDERELLLADDPKSFADACVRLYNDPLLWGRLRENAIERVGQDFSPKTFLDQLRQILP